MYILSILYKADFEWRGEALHALAVREQDLLLVAFAVVGVKENFGGELLSHFRVSGVERDVEIGGGSVEPADLVNFVFQVDGF